MVSDNARIGPSAKWLEHIFVSLQCLLPTRMAMLGSHLREMVYSVCAYLF